MKLQSNTNSLHKNS